MSRSEASAPGSAGSGPHTEDVPTGPEGSRPPSPFPRPRIVLSRCLEMAACRYNGRMIRSAVVRSLDPWVEWVPVCPEVEVGLGTPRDPIRLVSAGADGTRLVQPSTGRDLTARMHRFRQAFLDALGPVDGFLLKSRSPSCGIDGVKVFAAADGEEPVEREPGMFAAAVLERFPDLPVEHEARLAAPDVRHRFLTAVFASAERRRRNAGSGAGGPAPEPGEAGRGGGSALDPSYPPELREV